MADAGAAATLFHSSLQRIVTVIAELEALSASTVESPSLAVFDPVNSPQWQRKCYDRRSRLPA
jgi:hypothetical protein